jgi:hypothetical protein
MKINKKYLPKSLTKKDQKEQYKQLMKSRRLYVKGKYFTRKKMPSFKSKTSPHILKAEKIYKIDKKIPKKTPKKTLK